MSDAKGQQIADDEYRGFAPPIGVLPDAPVEFAPLIPNQQQQQYVFSSTFIIYMFDDCFIDHNVN